MKKTSAKEGIYNHFHLPTPAISGYRWFTVLCTSLLLLVTVYLATHWIINMNHQTLANKKIVYLNDAQKTIINNLLTDQQPTDSPAIRQTLHTYFQYNFPSVDTADKQHLYTIIQTLPLHNLPPILSTYPMREPSFLLLYDNWVYLEIIFWCLFGVYANLLYNMAEALRTSQFKKTEIYVQLSKLIYSPFCVIIIYICYNEISKTPAISSYSGYSIAVAFLLGFFSGRMIDLLNRLKDLLLPLGKGSDPQNDTTTQNTIPEEAFVNAIQNKSAEWHQQYGPFEGLSVSKKIVDGQTTPTFALQFHVLSKTTPTDPERTIPTTLPYTYNGTNYDLPTDVVQTATAQPNACYESTGGATYMGNILRPKQLGLSCSRQGSNAAGTIGFKAISRNSAITGAYLVSCYHVLCSNELTAGTFTLNNQNDTPDTTIVSPEHNQPGSSPIAQVRQGLLDTTLDAACALLTNPTALTNLLFGSSLTPTSIVIIGQSHANMQYPVRLAGRTSCTQTGYVVSHYCNQTVTYQSQGQSITITLEGVIKTCKISTFGDSGAPVVDWKGNAIGILFASDNTYSYIIPLLRVFNTFNLTLPNTNAQ